MALGIDAPTIFFAAGAEDFVIVYPGDGGNRRGYEDKYVTAGYALGGRGITTVTTDNPRPYVAREDYPAALRQHLADTIDETRRFAASAGTASPRIHLWGVSAGASAVAAEGPNHPEVMTVALTAPGSRIGVQRMCAGLARFPGRVFIVVGDQDTAVGTGIARQCYQAATRSSCRQLVIARGMDHHFSGPKGAQFFQRVPLWAFAGDDLQPPAGSLALISRTSPAPEMGGPLAV